MAKIAKKLPKKPKKFIDSDKDGLSDWEEINIYGSNPHDEDTDGDGVDDGEEVLQGRNPATGEKFKDFFIPHAGNNYKPKSLHHKRLLFHAASVLVVKLLLFVLVYFYPMTAWMTPDVSAEEGRKIIALTNTLRKRLNLDALTENQKLDQAAIKKVEDMLINQYFAHLSPQNFDLEYFLKLASYKNYITVGENLAMGFDNASEVMTAWENSPTHYSNLVDPNFTEIGVALAGGAYKEQDTVFTAQYFGLPKTNATAVTPKVEIKKTVDKTFAPGTKAVLSEKTDIATTTPIIEKATSTASTNLIVVATTTEQELLVATQVKPILAAHDAKITIDEPAGNKQDKVIRVEATLPAETQTANLEVLNNNIQMTPLASATNTETQDKKWVGQAVIQDNSKSVTPPIITLSTNAGEIQKVEVSDNNIVPQKTSLASQYWLFKNHPNKGLATIFDISSIYFKVLLGLAIFAMLLNIFIAIKKQHPKLIFSGLGLILFLVLMIIF
ncbi:MAG: CAP domain-containing protein [Candidatus Falkowbacteria bacterium]